MVSAFSFFTRENITLILAIFGSVGTLITWISKVVTSRKSVNVSLGRIYEPDKIFCCFLVFENKSRLPICINSVSVVIDGIPFPCAIIPHVSYTVTRKSGSKVIGEREYPSLALPLNLGGLSGSSGFLDFDIPQEYLQKISTPLTLQVSTNRGNLKQMKLEFEDYSDPGELL